mmetsp:Transcript_34829/g.68560  ORF Transcript_34829/g.68560 Transcript_34829/m.68560 type:complete len:229 (-) Transcript_34829:210-896(-)
MLAFAIAPLFAMFSSRASSKIQSQRVARRTLVTRMGPIDAFWPRSPAVAECVEAICREDGWDIRCTLGFEAARGLRSRVEDKTGSLLSAAVRESTSGDVGLQFAVAFDLESGSDPGSRSRSRGTVRLLGTSRYLSTSSATSDWKVTARDDDDVPTAIRWRLHCTDLVVGGSALVQEGPLYFDAFTTTERKRRGLEVGCGRVVVREGWGLIEKFETVGRFKITPRNPLV